MIAASWALSKLSIQGCACVRCRYNSNKAHQHEVDDMLEAMEEVLFQHGVDAVFAGHVHAYERGHRTYKCARMLTSIRMLQMRENTALCACFPLLQLEDCCSCWS